jgi:hypothetical protein
MRLMLEVILVEGSGDSGLARVGLTAALDIYVSSH